MNKISALYYCCNCKKICEKVDQLLFVEDTSPRGFCSETCIEEFYAPLISHYVKVEKNIRIEFGCLEEKNLDDHRQIESTLSGPDQIWKIENILGDEVFSFSKKFDVDESYNIIVLCMLFNQKPSFILMATMTRNDNFLSQFHVGTQVEDIEAFLTVDEEDLGSTQLDTEVLNSLEQKKSALLATLLEQRKKSDIDYEQFYLYEDYFQTTLDSPDEIYSLDDDLGEDLYAYIKAHYNEGVSFYYIIICARLVDGEELMFPVLSFPTLDPKLCDRYRTGEQVSGSLIN